MTATHSETTPVDQATSLREELAIPAEITPTRIRSGKSQLWPDLAELWRYRELLYFLALRDIKVRYKQTVLGIAWAILQPLFTMLIFAVIFGRLVGVDSDGLPYPLFAMAALLPWQLFSYALTQASNSLVAEQRLITKVYFPRLVVPIAAVFSGLADFAVAFVLVLALAGGYALAGYPLGISWAIVLIPLLVIFAVLTALAVGLWLAALNVRYRDVRYTVPFLTQAWLFLTPIAYPSTLIPEAYRPLYGLNPMAGVVEGFRWAMVGAPAPDPRLMTASAFAVLVALLGGLVYFRKTEGRFADVV